MRRLYMIWHANTCWAILIDLDMMSAESHMGAGWKMDASVVKFVTITCMSKSHCAVAELEGPMAVHTNVAGDNYSSVATISDHVQE